MRAALDVANQRIGLDGVVRTTDGHTVLHPDGIAFWDEKQVQVGRCGIAGLAAAGTA
jgi:hypothetical protein